MVQRFASVAERCTRSAQNRNTEIFAFIHCCISTVVCLEPTPDALCLYPYPHCTCCRPRPCGNGYLPVFLLLPSPCRGKEDRIPRLLRREADCVRNRRE